MSFAGEVREELLGQTGRTKHCQYAELAALYMICGQIFLGENGKKIIRFSSENLTVAKKCYILFKKAFHIVPEISMKGGRQFFLYVLQKQDVQRLMEQLCIEEDKGIAPEALLEKQCCKRAFLRGMFIAVGFVTDPNSRYHLELAAGNQSLATYIKKVMGFFGLEAKIVERKRNHIVYMKEGSAIVDFLNVVGAHKALLRFENVRILKEMRNSINRQVNCEAANIRKTVSAASRQTADIEYIHNTIGFGNLSDNLAAIARLRLANPEVSLKELGEMLDPPIGKSGVNHRLRKLSEVAENLRKHTHMEEKND